MEKIPCSVAMLTFNSGKTLRRALESVKDFDEIILCDGGSTDDTLSIAKEYNARVIPQDKKFQNRDGSLLDYAGVRNQCLDVAIHDWFFYIDSDECATAELVEAIRAIVDAPKQKELIYNISPRIVLDGVRIEHSSNYPGWQKRFFNRITGARFRKSVHERIGYDEKRYSAGHLSGHWLYFIASQHDIEKNKYYAYMDATSHQTKDFGKFIALVSMRLITAVKAFVKILYIQLRYGKQGTLPFDREYTRVQYHLYFLEHLFIYFFKKTI